MTMRRLVAVVALAVALGLPWLLLAHQASAQSTGQQRLYIPSLYGPVRLAGVYDCVEYEAGSILSTDVITLYPTGDSEYNTLGPYGGVLTGTWEYTPATRTLGFTEFRWESVTVELTMDRLWAARWIQDLNYEFEFACELRNGL
jgi:hypothetical protein